MRQKMRRWKLHHRSDLALEEIAKWTRPMLLGWVRYYLHAYEDLVVAREHLARYFAFYNDERPHTAAGFLAPSAAYYASRAAEHGFAEAA